MARFLSRGFLLATAGSDGTARVWTTGNVETPRLVLASHGTAPKDKAESTLPGHDAALRDVEFRPGKEGRYQALTTGADGVACLWEVSDLTNPQASLFPPPPLRAPGAPRRLDRLGFQPRRRAGGDRKPRRHGQGLGRRERKRTQGHQGRTRGDGSRGLGRDLQPRQWQVPAHVLGRREDAALPPRRRGLETCRRLDWLGVPAHPAALR